MSQYPTFVTPAGTLSQESMENLLIALMQMRDENGLIVRIKPSDIFQDWFLDMLPEGIK